MTDVVVTYDDTSKRVTVKCVEGAVLELRGDIARMFGFFNNTTIRAFDKKCFTLTLPETGNQYFYVYTDIIKSQYHGDVVVPILRTVTVKGKHGSQHIDNAFLGEIPKRIAVCMMDDDSYNGNYEKNPFNFQHYNVTQIGISVSGEEVPFKPMKLNLMKNCLLLPTALYSQVLENFMEIVEAS